MLFKYIQFYLHASTRHDIHSPFVFDLLTLVINDKKNHPAFSEIEQLRKKLLNDPEEIDIEDLGAGADKTGKTSKSIREIIRHSAKPPRYAKLLYRLCNRFEPEEILELGTSLGISTCYLSAGNPAAKLTSMEGCPEIANRARHNIHLLNKKQIRVLQGNFADLLPPYLASTQRLDLVFFDGNHRKEPTLDYFRQCLERASAKSLFIFDDIHWSREMEQAWEEIKQHPSVTVTIDLFFMGLVFFRTGQEKQHFTLRF